MKSPLNISTIGNIFYLDKHLSYKTIAESILLTFLMGFFAYIFKGTIFDVSDFLYIFLALSVLYLVYNYKILLDLFKKYYNLGLLSFFSSVMEIILALSFIFVYGKSTIGYIFAILWLFSGMTRVLIQATPALFYSDAKELSKVIQIFAYSRASYFSIILLLILNSLPQSTSLVYLSYLTIFLFINILMISNLNPYMTKHKSVGEAIKLIREIKQADTIKLNKLKEKTSLSEDYFNRLIKRWDNYNLVSIFGNRVELSNQLKLIKELG
jgi:hypothetical protein